MYAWSNFVIERNEAGQPTKTLKPGDEVTRQELGVTEMDWDMLVENGVIREQPYPDIPDNVSPAEYFRTLDSKRGKGQLTTTEVQERTQFQLPI